MITNTGKQIIAKYLLGTSPAYASYISLGCGRTPIEPGDIPPDYSNEVTMKFEMFRVPITSRGYINDNGTNKVVLTGELPTEERYEISEVAIYSAGANTSAGQYDSKTITAFADTEAWTYNTGTSSNSAIEPTSGIISTTGTVGSITGSGPWTATITGMSSTTGLNLGDAITATNGTGSLGGGGVYTVASIVSTTSITFTATGGTTPTAGTITNVIRTLDVNPIYALVIDTALADSATNNILITSKAIQTLASNFTFENATRAARYERCRYLNNVLMLRGNSSHIGLDTTNKFVLGSSPSYFNLSGQTVDFSRNSTADLLKIAFSVVNVNGNDTANIAEKIRVMVEFSSSDATQYAQMQCEILGSSILNNRYVVVEKRLDELVYSPTFSWNAISEIKIYASAIDNETTISNKQLTSNVATISTGSTPHGLVAGDNVTIYGVDSTFNGTYTVLSAPTSTSFTYAKTAANVTSTITTGNFDKVNSNYFVALDAIRLDNISTINPLYGMVGYALVETTNAVTVVKQTNTNNYIEFRFILDVS